MLHMSCDRALCIAAVVLPVLFSVPYAAFATSITYKSDATSTATGPTVDYGTLTWVRVAPASLSQLAHSLVLESVYRLCLWPELRPQTCPAPQSIRQGLIL